MTTTIAPSARRATTHTHGRNPAPLVVRLRDLAPHLNHLERAELALTWITEHADLIGAAQDSLAAAADTLRTPGLRP